MPKPSIVKNVVRECVRAQEPFFLKGPVGVGKSEIAQQVCDELKMELVDIRLSLMDPTDIKGFPAPDLAKGKMFWLPASFLPPMKAKTKGLLFLDEMNSAPPTVQAASYQLMLGRRIGDYILPDGWTVGAAGNRAIDRSLVNTTPAALNNRMVQLEIEPDLEEFVTYARTKGVNDSVIGFLRFKQDLLHKFDPSQNPDAFPTPRGWFKVNKMEKLISDPNTAHEVFKGILGPGAAADYRAFNEVRASLPTIEQISKVPDDAPVPQLVGALHAVTTSLASATTQASFEKFMRYVTRMPREWQVLYIRDAMNVCSSIRFTKPFTTWCIANADITL